MTNPSRIESLRTQHAHLDDQIQEAMNSSSFDQLELSKLKKQKLHLKEELHKISA